MPKEKHPVKKDSGEKLYWVKNEDNTITEVSETEVINNPREYLGKQIFEKPPWEYEIVIALKRKKSD